MERLAVQIQRPIACVGVGQYGEDSDRAASSGGIDAQIAVWNAGEDGMQMKSPDPQVVQAGTMVSRDYLGSYRSM